MTNVSGEQLVRTAWAVSAHLLELSEPDVSNALRALIAVLPSLDEHEAGAAGDRPPILPVHEAKTRLRVATLLLQYGENSEAEAVRHLQRAFVLTQGLGGEHNLRFHVAGRRKILVFVVKGVCAQREPLRAVRSDVLLEHDDCLRCNEEGEKK